MSVVLKRSYVQKHIMSLSSPGALDETISCWPGHCYDFLALPNEFCAFAGMGISLLLPVF